MKTFRHGIYSLLLLFLEKFINENDEMRPRRKGLKLEMIVDMNILFACNTFLQLRLNSNKAINIFLYQLKIFPGDYLVHEKLYEVFL